MSDLIDRMAAPAALTAPESAAPIAPGSPGHALDRSAPAKARRTVFAGYTAGQLVFGAGVVLLLVWAMWVTRVVTAEPPQRIVKADLSRIIGEYVQAQARSATPPDQVEGQMRQFMASLDAELQQRGAKGQVVLVGEAVLTKSVPDITPDVLNAVYASGVKRPQPASPAQMGQILRGAPQAPAQVPAAAAAAAPAPPGMMPSAFAAPVAQGPFGPMPAPAPVDPAAGAQPMPGASVSSFGGPNGAGGQ